MYLAGVAFFLARLFAGMHAARRLRRSSTALCGCLRRSAGVTVPVTIGAIRPVILLPAASGHWSHAKRAAVIHHELEHVRRRDPLLGCLAAVNKALFWFHPLAWWLEHHLAALAEYAADDAAILATGNRRAYAQTLLEVAEALAAGPRRLVAVPMARTSHVARRIDAILDPCRTPGRPITGRRRLVIALLACPLVYVAAAFQITGRFAPGWADERLARGIEALELGQNLTPAEVANLEQQLAGAPDDQAAHARLIAYYYLNRHFDDRQRHIVWMIQHHPDADILESPAVGFAPGGAPENYFSTLLPYWTAQVSQPGAGAKVLTRAASILEFSGELFAAEQALLRALAKDPTDRDVHIHLGLLYGRSIAGFEREIMAAFAPSPYANRQFAAHARHALEQSKDAVVLATASACLQSVEPDSAKLLERAQAIDPNSWIFTEPKPPALPADAETAIPAILYRVEPEYPPIITDFHQQRGTAYVEVTTNPDGSVKAVRQHRQFSGAPAFFLALRTAVRQWRFAPGEATFELPFPYDFTPKPQLLYRVEPVYPAEALLRRVEGYVTLRVLVGKDGSVMDARGWIGPPLLTPAAEEAVRAWRYQPPLRRGAAVDSSLVVDVEFRLPR
jgi:TonB family protein